MGMAFAPALALKLPWAAVLGNHDQESSLSREGVMRHIITMPHTLSRLNPDGLDIDGYGNYHIEIDGPEGSPLVNKSVLNLYFLDSGDKSTVSAIPGYGWIKPSQQVWFQKTSSQLQVYLKPSILHMLLCYYIRINLNLDPHEISIDITKSTGADNVQRCS